MNRIRKKAHFFIPFKSFTNLRGRTIHPPHLPITYHSSLFSYPHFKNAAALTGGYYPPLRKDLNLVRRGGYHPPAWIAQNLTGERSSPLRKDFSFVRTYYLFTITSYLIKSGFSAGLRKSPESAQTGRIKARS